MPKQLSQNKQLKHPKQANSQSAQEMRALRRDYNLTQTQLARVLCSGKQQVYYWEHGISKPKLLYKIIIARLAALAQVPKSKKKAASILQQIQTAEQSEGVLLLCRLLS